MVRVRRIDAGTLARPVRRADGSLVVQARIARTGIQKYRDASYPDGWRREYRSDSEVKASAASFQLVPFTLLHPPVMVTAENVTQYQRGMTGETVDFDGKWLNATIAVTARDAVDALERGMTQVSCGYECDLEMTPGVSPDGERYDCIQRHIAGNHVALVPDARAGAEAAVRMDAAISEQDPEPITHHKDTFMNLEQALAALAAANTKIGELTARADSAERDLKSTKSALATMEAERDDARQRADAAEKARKDAADAAPGKARERARLEGNARRVLGARCDSVDGKPAEIDLDKLDDRAVKLAVIKEVTNTDCSVDANGKPRLDEYVDARYDAALERAAQSADTFRQARDVIDTHRHDAGTSTSRARRDAARAEMIKSNREGYLPPGNNGAKVNAK